MFVRWPSEAVLRSYYRSKGIPCLLVVEAGAQAPVCTGLNEDWVRVPIARQDVESRVEALRQRTYGHSTPVIDPAGVLHFGKRSIALSSVQGHLVEQFVEHYGEVVYRAELNQRLAELVPNPTRNSLDLHIMRIRRRIGAVNLRIRTVRGCGYLLESQPEGHVGQLAVPSRSGQPTRAGLGA